MHIYPKNAKKRLIVFSIFILYKIQISIFLRKMLHEHPFIDTPHCTPHALRIF